MEDDIQIPAFIRRVMPHATEAELLEATHNVLEYMKVVMRIVERLAEEGKPEKVLKERRQARKEFEEFEQKHHVLSRLLVVLRQRAKRTLTKGFEK